MAQTSSASLKTLSPGKENYLLILQEQSLCLQIGGDFAPRKAAKHPPKPRLRHFTQTAKKYLAAPGREFQHLSWAHFTLHYYVPESQLPAEVYDQLPMTFLGGDWIQNSH